MMIPVHRRHTKHANNVTVSMNSFTKSSSQRLVNSVGNNDMNQGEVSDYLGHIVSSRESAPKKDPVVLGQREG